MLMTHEQQKALSRISHFYQSDTDYEWTYDDIGALLGIINTLLAAQPPPVPSDHGAYRRVQDPHDGTWDWQRIEVDDATPKS